MKKLRLVALLCCFVLLGISFNSCLDNNGPSIGNWWVGIATLKPLDEGDFYLQLDDSTTIKAVNNYIPHFDTDFERRVTLSFNYVDETIAGYTRAVEIYQMDTVLTKDVVPHLGEQNDEVYGTDPVELVQDWVWCEDGYLNIRFLAWFSGNPGNKHFMNLVRTASNEPNVFEFRHNAYNDPRMYKGEGLVAFRLKDVVETNGDESVPITIKYISDSGVTKEVIVSYYPKAGVNKQRSLSGTFEKVK